VTIDERTRVQTWTRTRKNIEHACPLISDGDKNLYLRIGLNKVIYYFIKHWLLSIIFGLRTALVAIRKIFTNKNQLGFQSDAQGILYESSFEHTVMIRNLRTAWSADRTTPPGPKIDRLWCVDPWL